MLVLDVYTIYNIIMIYTRSYISSSFGHFLQSFLCMDCDGLNNIYKGGEAGTFRRRTTAGTYLRNLWLLPPQESLAFIQ